MATFVHPMLSQRFTLAARTLVGRAEHCTFELKNRLVSGEHALVTWSEDAGWRVRDLGSRNGTFVNGQAVKPGERVQLTSGCELTFADERWRLSDDLPPVAIARDLDAEHLRLADGDLLLLPDDEEPQVMIFADRTSGGWVAEIEGDPRPVRDQETITVGEQRWELGLPPLEKQAGMLSTLGMEELSLSLSTVDRLRFVVDEGDEQEVGLTVVYRQQPIEVPARSHHILLLELARAIDADAGLPRSERGWRYVDAVCRALDVDAATLNTLIFRARKQFSSLGIGGSAQLIERRANTRQMRLGIDRVEFEPG
ncbi:MAG: FHA domain-containing protein [Myxococcales bacterium]|nr:FHA domain-containing protein [Myxococcales bacterium]